MCVRFKVLKKQSFYYVFAQQCWKNNGFIMFSFKNVDSFQKCIVFDLEAPNVTKTREKIWPSQNEQLNFDFSENPR